MTQTKLLLRFAKAFNVLGIDVDILTDGPNQAIIDVLRPFTFWPYNSFPMGIEKFFVVVDITKF